MSRVVIAGAGAIGTALAQKLAATHDVRAVRQSSDLPPSTGSLSWFQADLTTIHGAEVALTGAHTVVVLAQARRAPARLQRASLQDLDRLLGDSIARAAKQVDAKHLILFSNGDDDVRLPLLEKSGVPVSVLRGGFPDPVELLAGIVTSGAGAGHAQTASWTGVTPEERPPSIPTCSIQRYAHPAGWTALDVVRAYFKWLPSDVPLVKTTEYAGVFSIQFAGVRVLVLRLVPGRSTSDCAWLAMADGSMNGEGSSESRFEFRTLLDGVTTMAALVGYQPSLPWLVYRFTQSVLHERVMRHFGLWLAEQKGPPS